MSRHSTALFSPLFTSPLSLLALTLPASLFLQVSSARAQDVPVTPVTPPAQTAKTGRQETVKQIADRLTQTTGVRVLAESALGFQRVIAPDGPATRETLDAYLTRLARRLPSGTLALKIYLPPAGENRRASPEVIARLARAQRDLMGQAAPGMVQIQGRTLPLAEAEPVLRTLGLEPVYVLTNRLGPATAAGLASGGGTNALMDALTKQLGVAKVEDIPAGTYKVSLPGPDGSPMDATVEVETTGGNRRINVRMGSSTER